MKTLERNGLGCSTKGSTELKNECCFGVFSIKGVISELFELYPDLKRSF